MIKRNGLTAVWWFLISWSALTPTLFAQRASENSATLKVSNSKIRSTDEEDPRESDSQTPSTEQRVKEIEKRIDVIKDMMQRKQAEAAKKAAETVKPAEDLSLPSADVAKPADMVNPENAKQPEKVPDGVVENILPPPVKEPTETESPKKEPSPLEAFEIGTSQLNSFELANSLFVTGHYLQAQKGYQALLSSETSTLDQDWLRCLAANCYRVQGEIPTAEKLYREVVASKEKSYPSDQSKWYLDHLTRKKKIQSEWGLVEAELQSFQSQASQPEK